MRSVLYSSDHEWEWQRPLLGPSYWTCSFTSVLVISDILPPLSDIQIRYPSVVQRVLDGIDQISMRKDQSDWEIYFLGISCIYVSHAAKVLSRIDQSLDDFILQIQQWESREVKYNSVEDRSKSRSMYHQVANQQRGRNKNENGAGILGLPSQPSQSSRRSRRGSRRVT
jgi:hypothetical protein